ncbi:DNA replication/repair protein RecF [Salinispirillum marinum]|uniref:DNA replication and repair protein RecF n=2 Tax=Saccharospirillaceae TaxID=255527 RepID=A0ABV8BEJ0_9GAMM
MPLKRIDIHNFRNLTRVSFRPVHGFNIIVGCNGSGKSSLLEAVYALGSGKSFRVTQVKPLVQFTADRFLLYGEVQRKDGQHSLGLEKRLNGEGSVVIDGSRATTTSELALLLPIQHVGLDDFQLFEGGPRIRRRFIDWGVFHVEHGKNSALFRRFERAIKQRNSGLRSVKISGGERDAWDSEFLRCATSLDDARQAYLDRLMAAYRDLCARFGDVPYANQLMIHYSPGWDQKLTLKEALQRPGSMERERKTGITQAGPHRADLRMVIEGIPARDILSRGQMKVLGHLLKLAQIRVLANQHNDQLPVILLDDLVAELDERNVNKLLNTVREFSAQVFLTVLDTKQLPSQQHWLGEAEIKLFHVEQGQLTEQPFQE